MHLLNPRRFVPLLLLLSLFAAAPAMADDSPWEMKLPFQHATISYTIAGSENGTETLYIRDYGKQRAKKHEGITSMFGISNKTSSLEITDPDWLYIFDLVAKTGTKSTNPAKIFNEEYRKLSAAEQQNVKKNAKELGLSMANQFQGETVLKATQILGYDCDRTTVMGMTVNVIHQTDVPLLTEMNLLGMQSTVTATAIDTSAPPDAAFALPADITPVQDAEADALSQQMARDMVSTLKEPDGAEKMKAKWQSGAFGMPGADPAPEGRDNAVPDSLPGQAGREKASPPPSQGMPPEVQDALKGLFGK
ncbi:MAG TPA: hypothetical protein DDY20_04745 [Desulfobulbaceae bacterium]|nr:hypothetical protein [Desulfobulbaceae bacterium]